MKKRVIIASTMLLASSAYGFFGCYGGKGPKRFDIMYTVKTEGKVHYHAYQVKLEVPLTDGKVLGKDIMESFEKQFVESLLKKGDIKAGQYKVQYKMNNWGSRVCHQDIRYLNEEETIPQGFMADVHPIIILL